MCGFLVEYKLDSNKLLRPLHFKDLLALSHKRGPDTQATWSNNVNLQMGFNRLSILELSDAGKQPMSSHQSRYTIVFNGEIYNHLELRKQLVFTKFRGHSDTETITVCLEEWGIKKTVNALNGMFAIVIYDHLDKTISLVRDFAGIKPLFYGWNGKVLLAASQYNQITTHPEFKNNSINKDVLKLYLEQHYMPAPFGLYEHTFQVMPGEVITFKINKDKSHWRYWELPNHSEHVIHNKEEAMSLVDSALHNSVERQTLSDVPLGAFLSGGVDSTLVCSALKKNNPDTKVFTIGSDSKIHDESERATMFSEALDLQHHLWQLDAKSMVNHWDEAMRSLHEPMADFSILPTYLVSKLAKKQVTVALSGDGGDELFFGYERFWSIGKNIKYQHYPLLLRKAIYGYDKYASSNRNFNPLLLASKQGFAHQNLHSRFRKELLCELAPELAKIKLPEQYQVYNYEDSKTTNELFAKMRHAEFYGMMQKTLRKVDLASMENSLEVRVPFLDKEMIETSLKIDPLLSCSGYQSKQILKDLLSTKLPNIQQETVKKGFSIPLSKWFREDLRSILDERLLDSDLSAFGFDRSVVENMIKMHVTKEKDLKWPLFTLYALTQQMR